MNLTITSDIIDFYTYRTAHVNAEIWLDLDEYQHDELREYFKKQGKHIDNHICWKTSNGTCFMYTDGRLGIGTTIEVKSW